MLDGHLEGGDVVGLRKMIRELVRWCTKLTLLFFDE